MLTYFTRLTPEEYAIIAQEFDLPKCSRTAMIGGMPHYYNPYFGDGYDPFECELPVCENGDCIEIGGKYKISGCGVCEVIKITRSTIFHHFVVIDEDGEEKDWLKNDVPADSKKPLEIKPTATDCSDSGEIADKSGMILAKGDDEASLNENRWLAIKNEDGSPKAKMSKGISSIKQQLGEVEKFVNWYSKIKNENGVKRGDYYKRTNKSLHKIKERLMNLSEKIRTL